MRVSADAKSPRRKPRWFSSCRSFRHFGIPSATSSLRRSRSSTTSASRRYHHLVGACGKLVRGPVTATPCVQRWCGLFSTGLPANWFNLIASKWERNSSAVSKICTWSHVRNLDMGVSNVICSLESGLTGDSEKFDLELLLAAAR